MNNALFDFFGQGVIHLVYKKIFFEQKFFKNSFHNEEYL
jgi:hypothetical protein